MTRDLADAIAEMRDDEAVRLAEQQLEAGTPPLEVLESCRAGMAIVGERFERGEYFVPELILAGEILRQVSDLVKPHLGDEAAGPRLGTVVLGTVAGDIHDIGKDIVSFMLDINGFEVHDLGVDVPVETFVQTVREIRPPVLALSGLLTLAFESMRDTVRALEAAGLRDDVRIMVGGGATDEQVCAFAGADAYGADAMAAVNLAKRFTGAA